MSKDAKSTATIRRRKNRYKHSDLERLKNTCPSAATALEEVNEFKEADEGYLFDDEIFGPSIVKRSMSSEKTLFLALISMRIVNSLLIQTSFVPDEFWQSLEVSHNMVFGYGYLTWEWQHGLRGYMYPAVFAVLYKVLAILGLDYRILLIKLPRILQGVIAAWGDLYLYKLSWLLSDRATAQWTLLCQCTNWFMLYSSTRTITNSMETTLITAAMYYFPWPGKLNSRNSVKKFLILAALSIIIRPTAAVIWVLMCSWHLQDNHHQMWTTLKSYIVVGCSTLLLSATIDRLFCGQWIFVQYSFLKFNVLSGGGSFYGTHPWHWYLTQGYPVIMGTFLVPFLVGAWRARNKVPLFVIIWTTFVYSFLSHKEFRFLMPILPLSFHYCGMYFQSLCKKPKLKRKKQVNQKKDNIYGSHESLISSIDGSESNTTEISSEHSQASIDASGMTVDTDNIKDKIEEAPPQIAEEAKRRDLTTDEILAELEKKQHDTHKQNLSKAKICVIILLVTNIPVAMYFCLIHQRGTILVMKYLHDASQEQNIDVMFLMPCHSTPYYSYIHKKIKMRFLTCEPNINQRENYTDEADVFFNNPVQWLKKEYNGITQPWPSHLVYFKPLTKQLGTYLAQSGYRECANIFHTHLPEGRIGSHVIVSCR